MLDTFTLFYFPGKNHDNRNMLGISSVLGVMAFLFMTITPIVIYTYLKKKKRNTSEKRKETVISNVQKVGRSHVDRRCLKNVDVEGYIEIYAAGNDQSFTGKRVEGEANSADVEGYIDIYATGNHGNDQYFTGKSVGGEANSTDEEDTYMTL